MAKAITVWVEGLPHERKASVVQAAMDTVERVTGAAPSLAEVTTPKGKVTPAAAKKLLASTVAWAAKAHAQGKQVTTPKGKVTPAAWKKLLASTVAWAAKAHAQGKPVVVDACVPTPALRALAREGLPGCFVEVNAWSPLIPASTPEKKAKAEVAKRLKALGLEAYYYTQTGEVAAPLTADDPAAGCARDLAAALQARL